MQVLHNEPLQCWHTLASPSLARQLMIINSINDLKAVAPQAIIIGSGSNVVFMDDIDIPLAKMAIKGIEINQISHNCTAVSAMAGEQWHSFVTAMVALGLGGVENLALIPGTVGAAPVQNIGAYGVEVSDCIKSVEVYDRNTGKLVTINKEACGFSYRSSYFKTKWQQRYIIVKVTFELTSQPQLNLSYAGLDSHYPPLESIKDVYDAVVKIRKDKLPDPKRLPNAGSFFHNPVLSTEHYNNLLAKFPTIPCYKINDHLVKVPAAWLIEFCGFKGYREGGVGMYDKHALVLVNYAGTGRDIERFSHLIVEKVQNTFDITLQIEPRIIGT